MTQPRPPREAPADPDDPDDFPMSRRTRDRMTRRFLKKMAELYPDPPPGGWLTPEEALAQLPPPTGTKAG